MRISNLGARGGSVRCCPRRSAPLSMGSPSRLKTRPRHSSPTGTVIGPPCRRPVPADHAVGRRHRDGAHPVVAEAPLGRRPGSPGPPRRGRPTAPTPWRSVAVRAMVIALLILGQKMVHETDAPGLGPTSCVLVFSSGRSHKFPSGLSELSPLAATGRTKN